VSLFAGYVDDVLVVVAAAVDFLWESFVSLSHILCAFVRFMESLLD